MLLALCGIGLLAVASIAGLKETHGSRGDKAVASAVRPPLAAPVRSAVPAREPLKAPTRHAKRTGTAAGRRARLSVARTTAAAAAAAARRTRAAQSPVSAHTQPAPAAPAPKAPAPATPKAPAPSAPKTPAAPAVTFDQRGTTPGPGTGVPFDDSGAAPSSAQ
jgi:hypothetical protein